MKIHFVNRKYWLKNKFFRLEKMKSFKPVGFKVCFGNYELRIYY